MKLSKANEHLKSLPCSPIFKKGAESTYQVPVDEFQPPRPSLPVKPTHGDELRSACNASAGTAATGSVTVSTISKEINELTMYDSDSEASDGDANDVSRAYDHSFIVDGLGTEDEKRRPRSDNDYEREVLKMASTLRSVDGKANILVDGQKKGHEKLDTISTQQEKDSETLGSVKEGVDKLLERLDENEPTYKAQLEKEKALRRKETAKRLNAEKKAETLEEQLAKARNGKAQLNKKPSAVLSDQTNAESNAPLSKIQMKAETNHQVRLQPETQKKAAIKRSKRGRTLFGGEGF